MKAPPTRGAFFVRDDPPQVRRPSSGHVRGRARAAQRETVSSDDMKLLHTGYPWVGSDEIPDDEVVVAATRDDLSLLANALNEALASVDDWEFSPRLGGSPDEARVLRSKVKCILHETRRPQ